MIAKGNLHKNGQKLAAYMVKARAGERAELIEMRGFAASDLRDAFRDVEIQARGTYTPAPFFHAYTRLAKGETLEREQWLHIADRQEQKLGFAGQPRAVSFHHLKDGSTHMHVTWSRIALAENGKLFAIDPGFYVNKLKEVAREMELEYGLKIVSSERQPGNRARAADRAEFEESRRLRTNINAIRNAVLDSFEKSDNGAALKAALKSHGYELANGDRRDCFVVIDQAGGQHALTKKLTGLALAEIRERLSDLDRTKLPSVEQAQALQRDRQGELEHKKQHMPVRETAPVPSRKQPEIKPLGKTAGEIRLAWGITRTGEQFAQEIEKRGHILTYVTAEEARASERAAAFAKAAGRQNRALKEGFAVVDTRGTVTRIDQRTTGDQWEEIQKRLGGIDRAGFLTVAAARAQMKELNRAAWSEQKQAEREIARPPSALESRIVECAEQARHHGAVIERDGAGRRVFGAEALADRLKPDGERVNISATVFGPEAFAARLQETGIAIVRVTAADVIALDALRQEAELAATIARSEGVKNSDKNARHFVTVEAGELAAVTRGGDVHRVNPDKLRGVEIPAALPGVVEARGAFESNREKTDQLWTDLRAEILAEREEFAAGRKVAKATATAEKMVHQTFETPAAAVDTGIKTTGRILGGLAKGFERIGLFLDALIGGGPAKRTKEQVHQDAQARGNVETRDAHAYADFVEAKDVEHGDRVDAAIKTEQEKNLSFAQRYGTPATSEAVKGRERDEDYERERER